MAGKLKLNQEEMTNAQKVYEQAAQDMQDLRTSLNASIGRIRNAWNSDAGFAFFDKFDTQWDRNMADYTNVMQHMAENMQIANSRYQEVFDAAVQLKLK